MNAYMNQLNNWMYKYKLCDISCMLNESTNWMRWMYDYMSKWMNEWLVK